MLVVVASPFLLPEIEHSSDAHVEVPQVTTNREKRGSQCVHESAVNKAEWMFVDGSRIRQPELVAFVYQLSGSCKCSS